jgi:hypothetical protein
MIRYKYLRHQAMRLSDGTVSKSYDVVDEQAIESINHFHRKRIVM